MIHTPGPLLNVWTVYDAHGNRRLLTEPASHWWTLDGHRIGYLTPSWRHAVTLGPPVETRHDNPHPTYSVIDGGPGHPEGGRITLTPVPTAGIWWDDDLQPDADLLAIMRSR